MSPTVLALVPAPDTLAPAGLAELSVTFDRPMDPRRGRVRLVWGRISAHVINAERRMFRWSTRDPELAWSADGMTLRLAVPAGLLDGFRVRVEWSDLRGADGAPVDAGPDGVVPSVIAVGREFHADPPRLASRRRSGDDVRADAVFELYAASPVGVLDAARWRLDVEGLAIPFGIHQNRNPPDWLFVHPERPLPPGEGSLRIPADALRGTGGEPMDADWELRFRVAEPARAAVPHPRWSEPPDGFVGAPAARAALRFRGRPTLDPDAVVHLAGPDGDLGAAHVVHDPTPGHYRTLFLAHPAPLEPGAEYRFTWETLQPLGFPALPGAWRFTAGSAAMAPLANAASIFATPGGSFLQVVAQVQGPVDAVAVDVAGARRPLTRRERRGFTLSGGQSDGSFWELEDGRLPDAAEPGLRSFALHLDGRALHGHAFDMTPRGLTGLAVDVGEERVRIRWTRNAPVDSLYITVMTEAGIPGWCGLVSAREASVDVDRAWLTSGPLVAQVWMVRARPEDDLWDYFVDEVGFVIP